MFPRQRVLLFLLFCLIIISISYYLRFKYQEGIKIEKNNTIVVEFLPCFKEPKTVLTSSGSRIKDIFDLVNCKIYPVNSEVMEEIVRNGERIWMDSEGYLYKGRMDGFKLYTLGLTMPLNEASAEELAQIPGIGMELARRIVNERNVSGKFKDFRELLRVKGIGSAKLRALKEYTHIE